MDILELIHDNHDVTIRPFSCGLDPGRCSKAFARRSDLVRHERIHRNERPFQCTQCGKSFIQRSALTVHIRVHTGERPHMCLVEGCQKAFADSSSLARHRRVHTGKRPYKCSVVGCCKTFCRKTTLTKHTNRNHSINALATSGSGTLESAEPSSGADNSTDEEEEPISMTQFLYGHPPAESRSTMSPDSFPSPSSETLSNVESHSRALNESKMFLLSQAPTYFSEASSLFDRSVEQNTCPASLTTVQQHPESSAAEPLHYLTHGFHLSSCASSPQIFAEPPVSHAPQSSEHAPLQDEKPDIPKAAFANQLHSFFEFPKLGRPASLANPVASTLSHPYSLSSGTPSFCEGSPPADYVPDHVPDHKFVYLEPASLAREANLGLDAPGYAALTRPFEKAIVTETEISSSPASAPLSQPTTIRQLDGHRYVPLASRLPIGSALNHIDSFSQDTRAFFTYPYRSASGTAVSFGTNPSPSLNIFSSSSGITLPNFLKSSTPPHSPMTGTVAPAPQYGEQNFTPELSTPKPDTPYRTFTPYHTI